MKRAALLALLLLIPLFPFGDAAGPEPRPWAPYNAVSEISAIALAREGATVAAALKPGSTATPTPAVTPPVTLPGGQPPAPPCAAGQATGGAAPPGACSDLAILDLDTGWARNGTITAQLPVGRTHVAVSRDGTSVASVGVDGPDPNARQLRIQYQRIPQGMNWSAAVSQDRVFESSLNVAPPTAVVAGLLVSDDGRRVALLTSESGSYVLRGFAHSGSTFVSAFEQRAPGTARALGAASDLARLVIAGQFPLGNFTYGGAYVVPFARAEALSSWFDTRQNGTDVVSAGMSSDGRTIALGGADGRLHVFHGATLDAPETLTVAGSALGNMTLSEDGSRVAAVVGLTLSQIDVTERPPQFLWNATLAGTAFTSLATNRTGGLILAGTSGTGGAVWAYSDVGPEPMWSVPGDTRAVAVDSDGTRVAYAQRAAISAARLPRLLSMELAEGGKLAPQRTLTVPGTTMYNVTLRNEGGAAERVVFEGGSPEITVSGDPVVVRPGTIVRANITVAVQHGFVGPRVFNVTARSTSSGVQDNVTLAVAPKPTLDVKLSLNQTDVLAQPGATSTILMRIVNNGTSDSAVTLSGVQVVSAGALWDLRVSQTSFTALRGTSTAISVEMTPPANVVNGTSSTVTFRLEGQDVFDTATVTYRVNPDLKVKVNATGVTKFIEPGKRASYNVTVTNIGSLPRQFEIFYTITEATGRSWGVDMPSQTVRIDPEQKRVLPVTIIAPGDVEPNERVSVRVSARSIPEQVNETAVIDNVTLFGVGIPLRITTTTTTPLGIPFLEPVLVLPLLVGLALLARRRRP